MTATEAVGGWPDNVYGPSAIPWGEGSPHPKEASVEYIKSITDAFAASAKRAVEAGVDVIEIRGFPLSWYQGSMLTTLWQRR